MQWCTATEHPPVIMIEIFHAPAPVPPPAPPPVQKRRKLISGTKNGSGNTNMATASSSNIPAIATALNVNFYTNVIIAKEHHMGRTLAPINNSLLVWKYILTL